MRLSVPRCEAEIYETCRVRNERILDRTSIVLDQRHADRSAPWSQHNLPSLPEAAPVVPASLHYWAASLSLATSLPSSHRRESQEAFERTKDCSSHGERRQTEVRRHFRSQNSPTPALTYNDLHTTHRRVPDTDEKSERRSQTRAEKDINAPSPPALPTKVNSSP